MKLLQLIVLAVFASFSGFVVHVMTVEWLPSWIEVQMEGVKVQPSWNVRYIAGVTSLEYGVAAVGIYYLAREKLIFLGRFKAAILFAILLTSIHGALIRQPLMDYVVGNPIHVVFVQNGAKWIVWLLMSLVVVYGYEYIYSRKSANT